MQKKALNIVTFDSNGNDFELAKLSGKKILLTFYRDVYCPFCNLRIRELTSLNEEFKKNNAVMVGIFNSSITEIQQHNQKRNFNLILIPDPNNIFYKQYQINQNHAGMLKAFLRARRMIEFTRKGFFTLKSMSKSPILPADFLIDENQIIVRSFQGKDFGDHLDITEILNFIRN